MTCPACGAVVGESSVHCQSCGARITAPAAVTAGLPPTPATGALHAAQSPAARPRRRWRLPFFVGLILGMLLAPALIALYLLIFGGTNEARRQSPPPFNQPDVSVLISRSYLERAMSQSPKFRNPRITLGRHPVGGAALTITVGLEFPLVGFQDVQASTQVIASNGKLVVTIERAGLGEHGGLGIPGTLVERAISEMINDELDKRIRANPTLEIDIVRVDGSAEALQVDAALRQAGQ